MFSTQFTKYLSAAAILFASCSVSRNVTTLAAEEGKPTITVAVATCNLSKEASDTTAPQPVLEQQATTETVEETPEATTALATAKTKKKITSFAQMKEMARSGEIAMSKKDLKTLNRLEKHYKGNYEQFRADTFEFTDKAKIIGGVGLLGLLLAIITGSAFGWFLFIVAALAFLLRYLNIIAF